MVQAVVSCTSCTNFQELIPVHRKHALGSMPQAE